MKKTVLFITIIVIFISKLSINAYSAENRESSFDYSSFYEEIDRQTEKLLNELGVDAQNSEGLLNLSPRKIISLLIELIKGEWKTPFKCLGMALCICVMSTVVNTLNVSSLKNESLYDFFVSSIIMITVITPLSSAFVSAISAMKLLSNFMLAYVPVFTAVISASGMTLSAFSYNAVILSFSEICSKVSMDFIIPSVFVMTLLGVYSSADKNTDISDLISVIRKVITLGLSLLGTVFTGLLSLKSKISVAADSIAVKGIKLISGSVIPIVGGAIGDAFSSVLGSFLLIKNTIGAFGIVVILLTVLPSVLSLVLWWISISVCSSVCKFTGNAMSASMLKNISTCLSLVNIILLFFTTVFIISTGIMLDLRG